MQKVYYPSNSIIGSTEVIDKAVRAQVNFTVRYTIRLRFRGGRSARYFYYSNNILQPGAQFTPADRVCHFIWMECTRPIGYQANQ